MPIIQQQQANKGYLLGIFKDFKGGWVVDKAPDTLEDNELELMDNIETSLVGALPKRGGTAPLSLDLGAAVSTLIEWNRKDGTTLYLGVVGTNLVKFDSSWVATTVKALTSASIGYFFYNDRFYFTGKESGTDKYWNYDGTTVSEVVANGDPSNDLAPIKRCRNFVWNPKNFRIYAALDPSDQSCLYYSEANDPTYFKSTNKLYPTTGEGAIKKLSAFAGGVVVHFLNSLWAFTGVAIDSDATWGKIPVVHGTTAAGSVCSTPNSLTMAGIGGIFALSSSALDKDMLLLQGENISRNIAQNKVASVIRSAVHADTMCSAYQQAKSKYMLAYGDDATDTHNNRVLVYDWELGAFARFTGLQIDCFCPCADGNIYAGSGNYVIQLDTGYNDWDVATGAYKAIDVKAWSKQWDLGSPYHIKKTKKTFLSVYQRTATSTTISEMGVKAGYRDIVFRDIPIDETFVWGKEWGAVWGWTDVLTKEFKTKLKANRIQWRFEHNELDEDLLIYGVAFMYKLKKAKGVKYNGEAYKNVLS